MFVTEWPQTFLYARGINTKPHLKYSQKKKQVLKKLQIGIKKGLWHNFIWRKHGLDKREIGTNNPGKKHLQVNLTKILAQKFGCKLNLMPILSKTKKAQAMTVQQPHLQGELTSNLNTTDWTSNGLCHNTRASETKQKLLWANIQYPQQWRPVQVCLEEKWKHVIHTCGSVELSEKDLFELFEWKWFGQVAPVLPMSLFQKAFVFLCGDMNTFSTVQPPHHMWIMPCVVGSQSSFFVRLSQQHMWINVLCGHQMLFCMRRICCTHGEFGVIRTVKQHQLRWF